MPISPCWKLHHNKGDECLSIHLLLAIHYRNLFHKCLLIWLYLQTTTKKHKAFYKLIHHTRLASWLPTTPFIEQRKVFWEYPECNLPQPHFLPKFLPVMSYDLLHASLILHQAPQGSITFPNDPWPSANLHDLPCCSSRFRNDFCYPPYNLCKQISSINKYLPAGPKDISLKRVYCMYNRVFCVSYPQYFCHSSNVFLAHTSMCLLVLWILFVHIICFKRARLRKYLIRSKFIIDNKNCIINYNRELGQSA
jgi:hypothetical protein